MSTLNAGKKPRGRPKVDSEQISVRFDRPLLERIDMVASGGALSRPEAVRKLVALGLDSMDPD